MTPAQKQAYMRQYRLDHPDLMLNYARRSSANKRARFYGAPGVLSLTDVETVMAAGRCFYCGSTKKLGLDHVNPLHAGGHNDISNLVCCCHFCNQSKGRADRPGRWSQSYEACIDCGKTERPHVGHGLCKRCRRARDKKPRDIHWNAKVTKSDVVNIRHRAAHGESIGAIDREYGLAWQTVAADMVRRRTWVHVEEPPGGRIVTVSDLTDRFLTPEERVRISRQPPPSAPLPTKVERVDVPTYRWGVDPYPKCEPGHFVKHSEPWGREHLGDSTCWMCGKVLCEWRPAGWRGRR